MSSPMSKITHLKQRENRDREHDLYTQLERLVVMICFATFSLEPFSVRYEGQSMARFLLLLERLYAFCCL